MGAQQSVPERLHVTADDSRVPAVYLGLYEIREAKVHGKATWQKVEGADSCGVDAFITSSSTNQWLFHTANLTGCDKGWISSPELQETGGSAGRSSPHEYNGCWEVSQVGQEVKWAKSPTLRVRRVDSPADPPVSWSTMLTQSAPQINGLRLSADDDDELHASVKAVLQHGQTYPCHSALPWA